MRKLIEATFVSLDGVIDDTRPSTVSRAEPQHWGHLPHVREHGAGAQRGGLAPPVPGRLERVERP